MVCFSYTPTPFWQAVLEIFTILCYTTHNTKLKNNKIYGEAYEILPYVRRVP